MSEQGSIPSPNPSPKTSIKKKNKPEKKEQVPQSPPNPSDIKLMDQSISITKNRVNLLRQQLERQKDGIRKNRSLTKQIIAKKMSANEVNQMNQKDSNEEILRLERLREKNRSARLQHKKSLQDIQRAIYLVKLDDARELKNISLQHKNRIREIEQKSINSAIDKKQKCKRHRSKVKARYMQYWKMKISSAEPQKQMSIEEIVKNKNIKAKQLQQLESQQAKLKSLFQKYHKKNLSSKKQYVAALSLPMKDLSEAIEKGSPTVKNVTITDITDRSSFKSKSVMDISSQIKSKQPRSPSSIGKSRYEKNTQPVNYGPKIKIPKTQVNKQKFSIILTQLKQIEKRRLKAEEEARIKAEQEEKKQKEKWKRK